MALFIGLMSGTSLDGVDGILAESVPGPGTLREVAFAHLPFTADLRAELLALNQPGEDELHRGALAGNAVARIYAEAVECLLTRAGIGARQVTAIGAHGQTVRHRPREFDGTGYTLQLLSGALLAERTGIDVVCDFRSRDLAAGGEGAPLVPAFHAAIFGRPGCDVAVLNVGGIANLTLLSAQGAVGGFDCGPGNVLMDLWSQRHTGRPYDSGGAWAASGHIDATLMRQMLAEPYMSRLPPKSTGRELFNASWLDTHLCVAGAAGRRAEDVMATLAEFTARGAVDALARHAPHSQRVFVCGGGAFNGHLMRRLQALLGSDVAVCSTESAGVSPERVEALAFAWLGKQFVGRNPGNLPEVTGAAGLRVLGALYPGCVSLGRE